jgi:hypothetical protein
MPSSIYPAPTPNFVSASSYTVPAAQTFYSVSGKTFDSGIYTITTFPTTSQVTVTFADTTNTFKVTTVGGTATSSLSFVPTLTTMWTDTGTNVLVTLNRTAAALNAGGLSGTLDTITSSGTYNQTGKLFVVAISGGWGGGRGGSGPALPQTNDEFAGGRGGWGGSWAVYGPAIVNTATTVTVGTGGNGEAASNTSNVGAGYGNAGGTTSFGNFAVANASNTNLNKANGGNPNGAGYIGPGTSASSILYRDISANGTNGGGGQGAGTANGASNGLGSGIGTGGNGSSSTNLPGNAGTGYGAGGGGGRQTARFNGTAGGAGSPGVIYVLRGF